MDGWYPLRRDPAAVAWRCVARGNSSHRRCARAVDGRRV